MVTTDSKTLNKGKYYYMRLHKETFSNESKDAIDALIAEVSDHLNRRRKSKPLAMAVAAIIADLLAIPESKKGSPYAYRCIGAHAFWDRPVGYLPFTEARTALEALGYVSVDIGFKAITGSGEVSQATKFRRTRKLNDFLSSFGISPGNRDSHFRNRHPSETLVCPVEMRKASKKAHGAYGPKTKGKAVKPNFSHPRMKSELQRMKRVNEFLFQQNIELYLPMTGVFSPFNGVRRLFNNADKRVYEFEGGRLYDQGYSYQSLSKALRRGIRINGEWTAELDVGSCFLSIFIHCNGGIVDPAVDLYERCAIPREIAKKFVGKTMGSNKLPRCWSKDLKAEYEQDQREAGVEHPTALQDDYPIGEVRKAVLDALPVLRRWNDSKIRWGILFYLESEAMLTAMEQLMALGVPSLPVHDSLIVPASQVKAARNAMTAAFKSVIGFEPRIK